jgi:hypothetical protein
VFNVTVPRHTDGTGASVHIAGFLDRLDGGHPQWDAGATPLTRVDATHWTITFTGLEGTQLEYKYALGDFWYVEKDGACGEIANRQLTLSYGATGTQTVNDTSRTGATWRPAGTSPRPGAGRAAGPGVHLGHGGLRLVVSGPRAPPAAWPARQRAAAWPARQTRARTSGSRFCAPSTQNHEGPAVAFAIRRAGRARQRTVRRNTRQARIGQGSAGSDAGAPPGSGPGTRSER